MVPMTVTPQAQTLVAQMFIRAARAGAQHLPRVEGIELFCHALDAQNVLFGTAKVDGHSQILTDDILAMLRRITPPKQRALPNPFKSRQSRR